MHPLLSLLQQRWLDLCHVASSHQLRHWSPVGRGGSIFLQPFFFMLELDGPTMTLNIGVGKLQTNQALTTVLCEGGETVLGVELEC